MVRALAAGGAFVLGAACSAAVERVFTPPAVALRGVEVTGVGVNGAALAVTLAIANANPYPLSATRASYRLLTADSTEVGAGFATDPLRVGARDSVTVRLPLTVSWSALGRAGRGAIQAGMVDYRVIGEVVASTPVGEHAVPIDARGRFAPLRPVR